MGDTGHGRASREAKGPGASGLGGQWTRWGGKQRLAGAGLGRDGGAASSTFPAAGRDDRGSLTGSRVPAEGGCGCHPPRPATTPPPAAPTVGGDGERAAPPGWSRERGVLFGERSGGVRTGLRAASSRRLRPHRRGVGADSRGDPEGPARLPRDGAPTGPGEQEWLGPSPAPGSSLLPTVPAPPLPVPGDFNPWRQRAPTPPLLTGAWSRSQDPAHESGGRGREVRSRHRKRRGVIKEERNNRLPPAPVAALLLSPSCQTHPPTHPPGPLGHPGCVCVCPLGLLCLGMAPKCGRPLLPPGTWPVPVGGSVTPGGARPCAMG